jgi:hypothetical protein
MSAAETFWVGSWWVYVILFAFAVIPATAGFIALLAFLTANSAAYAAKYAR